MTGVSTESGHQRSYGAVPPNTFLLPGRRLVRGANITPNATQGATWAACWVTAWDSTWMQAQVNAAVGPPGTNNLGVNLIRSILPLTSIADGTITFAQFQPNFLTFMGMLGSAGIPYFYPAFGDNTGVIDSNFTAYKTACVQLAQLIVSEGYMSMIPFVETAQESFNYSAAYSSSGNGAWPQGQHVTLSNAIKAVSGWTALTTTSGTVGSHANLVTYAGPMAAQISSYVDFLDIHYYMGNSGVNSDIGLLWASGAAPLKTVLIGEYGQAQSAGQTNVAANYAQMNAMLKTSGPNGELPAGAGVWAISDQDTVTSNQWGCFSNSSDVLTPRATSVSTYQAMPY